MRTLILIAYPVIGYLLLLGFARKARNSKASMLNLKTGHDAACVALLFIAGWPLIPAFAVLALLGEIANTIQNGGAK